MIIIYEKEDDNWSAIYKITDERSLGRIIEIAQVHHIIGGRAETMFNTIRE
ncbi:MAG: hypothetical protein OQK57_05455 [Ignavibacteriaceae bacterium]|nr:hypothetical protein [Ignavibacteriaceae bacterium]